MTMVNVPTNSHNFHDLYDVQSRLGWLEKADLLLVSCSGASYPKCLQVMVLIAVVCY